MSTIFQWWDLCYQLVFGSIRCGPGLGYKLVSSSAGPPPDTRVPLLFHEDQYLAAPILLTLLSSRQITIIRLTPRCQIRLVLPLAKEPLVLFQPPPQSDGRSPITAIERCHRVTSSHHPLLSRATGYFRFFTFQTRRLGSGDGGDGGGLEAGGIR